MKISFTTLLIIFSVGLLSGSSPFYLDLDLNWEQATQTINLNGTSLDRLQFKGAFFPEEDPLLPRVIQQLALDGPGAPIVEIESVSYEYLNYSGQQSWTIANSLSFNTTIEKDRGRYIGKLDFIPLIREGQRIKGVKKIRLRITQREAIPLQTRSLVFANESILQDGSIYKLSIPKAGVYKLSYSFLRDELGIPLDNINTQNLQIFGQKGGMAPELPSADPLDDLIEVPILIQNGSNNRLIPGAYLLFYSEGPDRWVFDETEEAFNLEKHLYADEHYVFLKIGNGIGSRVATKASLPAANTPINTFDDYQHLEEDKVNLHYYWGKTLGKAQGSGQKWYGDQFKNVRSYDYSNRFQFPNIINNIPLKVKARMALRSEQRSRFNVSLDGQSAQSSQASSVAALSGPNDNINNFAYEALLQATYLVSNEQPQILIDYPFPQSSNDGSEAWLDYIRVQARRALQMEGDQMAFRAMESRNLQQVAYELSNASSNLLVWNVSDPLRISQQEYQLTGSTLQFGVENSAGIIPQFVAFNPAQQLLVPSAVEQVENQNLHALRDIDMLILSPVDFLAEAQSLASHRNSRDQLRVAVIDIEQVYNEFGGGRKDPAAIRDFIRMLYQRDNEFRYVLLFGDGSFDHKDFYGLGNNYIPTYQRESFNPLFAFPADDYYGILEEGSADPLRGRLNVSIGRIPVQNVQEAQQAVRKIRHYDNDTGNLNDWRNRLVFVADDEDSSVHAIDANRIADRFSGQFSEFNLDKIYLDAFPQISTPGGNRFPQVTEALNQAIFKGALIVTYLGHGGEEGWAQERILDISHITSWNNFDNLTLLMTATCSFTGYDDPDFVSAGEESFLNTRGGAVALMTTVRAVYANQNARLTELALEKLFTPIDGRIPTLGEAMKAAKNELTSGSITVNSRKFTLIGDPAQRLAIPEYRVETTGIDQKTVEANQLDTLRALQIVKISGALTDNNGTPLSDFNGIIYPTVYDKAVELQTLGQDQSSRVFDYDIQKNIIFKGRATVRNGTFDFSFVIPKDINYEFGNGKISYYASDTQKGIDANGDYRNVIIGGSNAGNIADEEGPQIDLFMNTEDFVFGGLTDPNPTLVVKLEDEFGINVVGNSIGHDLEAVLDDDSQNAFLLNDFFQAELDDFTKGEVRFPLTDLSEGIHRLKVKAWDVANNSSEGYTEFLVASSEELLLEHVLNYPNPFSDRTCFQFDHNYANQDLEVLVQIFTVSGRLVKTLEATMFSDGAIRQDDCLEWDGKDQYGDQLARGVYLYQVKVRTNIPGLEQVVGKSKFQKLVLLK